MGPSENFQISEESRIGSARRAGVYLAEELGFDEVRCGKVALVITEAGTNLVKHGGGGELVLQVVQRSGGRCLEVLVIDRGDGMADTSVCMRDGYSTSGTLGGGLGAIARLSDAFDIFSEVGKGTIIVAKFWQPTAAAKTSAFDVGSLQLAYPGEDVCGDQWATYQDGSRTVFAVVDGLGHGPEAANASKKALALFEGCFHLSPSDTLKTMHAQMKNSRGAAAAVAAIDRESNIVTYCGVGNIVGIIANDTASQSMISRDGTVGYIAPSFHDHKYVWSPSSVLIMHSDGLSSRYRPDSLGRSVCHDPGVIAALFLRDCKRARDDITVLVAKEQGT